MSQINFISPGDGESRIDSDAPNVKLSVVKQEILNRMIDMLISALTKIHTHTIFGIIDHSVMCPNAC